MLAQYLVLHQLLLDLIGLLLINSFVNSLVFIVLRSHFSLVHDLLHRLATNAIADEPVMRDRPLWRGLVVLLLILRQDLFFVTHTSTQRVSGHLLAVFRGARPHYFVQLLRSQSGAPEHEGLFTVLEIVGVRVASGLEHLLHVLRVRHRGVLSTLGPGITSRDV